jgi:ribA/ribD-fused uncharacterized protein
MHQSMAWDLEGLRERVRRQERFDYLLFWGHRVPEDGRITASCLSQWYPSPFEVEGCRYATAEHWMMAEKARLFADDAALARILEAKSPDQAKKLGRGVNGFDEARWRAERFDIVARGSTHKFGQNHALRAFLRGTGDKVLVEASPTDRIWGIGLSASSPDALDPQKWRGLNLLGFALMEARELLR